MKTCIAYIRKSTDKRQTHSYERQMSIINDFADREGYKVIDTFVEQASGLSCDREALSNALEASRKQKVPVIVSSISRLSRSVSFGSALLNDESLKIIVADLGVEADPFLLNILLCVAQKEADLISRRTKQSLAVLKSKGVKLGNPQWEKSINSARDAKQKNTARRDEKYLKSIKLIQLSGVTSYRGIARQMNEMGIQSPTGGSVHQTFVRNILRRNDLSSGL